MDSRPPPRWEFSLVAGGPLHGLLRRLGLTKPGSPGLARRAAVAVLVTWVPLVVLSAVEGLAIGHKVRLPLLNDFAVYTRLLIAIPLLILAEGIVERHVAGVVMHLAHSELLPNSEHPRYERALEQCRALCDSVLAEGILLVLAGVNVVIAHTQFPFPFSSWRSLVVDAAHVRTMAGWWYLIVGVGLLQFLLWRWLWRLAIWYRFLWLVSRLDLRLIPTHPDRAAGLGFIGETQRSFWLIVFAMSAATSGVLADEIVHAGVPLQSYQMAVAGYVAMALLVFLGPLLMFMPMLIEAKRKSLHDYSAFAVHHNQMFDRKWVQGDNPAGDSALGTPEISSLADLGNAYDVLDRMRQVPFDPADAMVLAVAALVPMAPLLLTIMPLDKLLELMSKVLV
jgi:hypothetical protein